MKTNHQSTFFLHYVGIFSLLVLSMACKKDDALTPDPIEEKAPKLQKVAFSENDFYAFAYTEDGTLQSFTSQWVYTQDGSLQTRKVTTDYTYNEAGLLVLATTQGLQTKYFYTGNTLSRTEEYDHHNRLVVTKHYSFDGQKKLREVHDVITDPMENNTVTGEFKKVFEYDNRGNLVMLTDLTKQENGTYDIRRTTHYEGFDSKKYIEPELHPYLPSVRLFVNNPLSETIKNKEGAIVHPVQTYSYEYNAEGYPVKKVITYTGGTQPGTDTVLYTYLSE